MHIRNPMEWVVAQFAATGEIGRAPAAEYWPATRGATAPPEVVRITLADLREAVRRGVHDFAAARTDLVFLCLIYPVVALFIAVADTHENLLPLLFYTIVGFILVGPLFALGLYEMSRHRELTGQTRWLDTFQVLRSPSLGAIVGLGALLIAIFLLWLMIAQAVYNAMLGASQPASFLQFFASLFTTRAGWATIGLDLAAGLVCSVAVLMISVVSFPLLLDRPVGLHTAIATSVVAVRHNVIPLAAWGGFVALCLLLGSLPCFIGLIAVLPILGHSTWHLYRHIVRPLAVRP
jgi:uncharacterized membrane protein